jgi:hypothetical protein
MVLGAEFVIVVRDLSWVGDIEGTHSKVGIAQSSQLFVGRVYVLLERPWLQKWVGMSHLVGRLTSETKEKLKTGYIQRLFMVVLVYLRMLRRCT